MPDTPEPQWETVGDLLSVGGDSLPPLEIPSSPDSLPPAQDSPPPAQDDEDDSILRTVAGEVDRLRTEMFTEMDDLDSASTGSSEFWETTTWLPGGGGGGGRDSFPAKIVSGGPIDYTCDLYENGKDSYPTQSGATVELLSLNIGETIPTGTWVIVCRTAVQVTGGS